jgi:hypothetical protein
LAPDHFPHTHKSGGILHIQHALDGKQQSFAGTSLRAAGRPAPAVAIRSRRTAVAVKAAGEVTVRLRCAAVWWCFCCVPLQQERVWLIMYVHAQVVVVLVLVATAPKAGGVCPPAPPPPQPHPRPPKTTKLNHQTKVEIDKPLGLRFAQSKAAGGGLEVTGVSGNAAKSGIKVGDTVIYTSSFFGDELWPADKLQFSVRR